MGLRIPAAIHRSAWCNVEEMLLLLFLYAAASYHSNECAISFREENLFESVDLRHKNALKGTSVDGKWCMTTYQDSQVK